MKQFVVSAMALLACAGAARANVLANPGFEAGTAPGNPDAYGAAGWNAFGNVYTVSAANPVPVGPHGGTGALKEFGTFPGVSGVFQSFSASPGDLWSMTGWGLNASSDLMQPDNFGLLKISFFNSGGGEIAGFESNHIDVNSPVDQWFALSASGVAPAGTVSVNLFCLFVQPNFNGGSAHFDDISAVPAPASAALLGLGGLVALRRRR